LRARHTAPGSMSIDRMSGTGRSGRAAICGSLDKELDLIVDALPSAEEDTVGKPVTKNEATGFVNRLQRLKKIYFGECVRRDLSNVLGCKQKSADLMVRSEQ